MNDRAFIAELHDIGKLVDKDSLKNQNIQFTGHTFHNFDFSQIGIAPPTSPSWWGQFSDEIRSLSSTKKIPKEHLSDVLLTNIADEIAASISRTWGKKGQVSDGIFVLWNPKFYQNEMNAGKKWAVFDTPEKLKEMFRFIDKCSFSEEFLKTYEDNLLLTAEDKSAPFNITDLYTHLDLTGKIFRILKKHSWFDQQKNKLIYCGNEINSINEATGGRIDQINQKGKWIYRLVFCQVKFSNELIRLQDLNVFQKRIDIIKAFSENENTRDYVLFSTADFLCLFVPKEEELPLQILMKPFIDSGLILDYKELEAELNLLTSSIGRQYKTFHEKRTNRNLKLFEKRLGPEIPAEISPPLCDSCQVRPGQERIKDKIHEHLCDDCYNIREIGEPAVVYAKWDEEDVKAAWLKISLDQQHLDETIRTLFKKYVYSHPTMQPVQAGDKKILIEMFRPLAVQMSFIRDYQSFLDDFSAQIFTIKQRDQSPLYTDDSFLFPIEGYNEFGIFKVKSSEEILPVLDLFYDLLEVHFPECLDSSPIKFSMSIARTKYPYRNHWEFLSKPKKDITFRLQEAVFFHLLYNNIDPLEKSYKMTIKEQVIGFTGCRILIKKPKVKW